MLQLRNIKRRINNMRKTAGGGGGVEVCSGTSSSRGDVNIRSNTRGVNRFDTRRRQNRLGRSLWDSETGRRSVYGERVLKKENKRINKKSDRHTQGEHEDTRTQIKRDKKEYKQQGNGKSVFRQHICKSRREHVRRQQPTTPNTRQRVYLQYKYPESVFNGPDADTPIAKGIRRAKNELRAGLREVKRERNIKETKHKRISFLCKGVTNKKRRNRQTNIRGGTKSSN